MTETSPPPADPLSSASPSLACTSAIRLCSFWASLSMLPRFFIIAPSLAGVWAQRGCRPTIARQRSGRQESYRAPALCASPRPAHRSGRACAPSPARRASARARRRGRATTDQGRPVQRPSMSATRAGRSDGAPTGRATARSGRARNARAWPPRAASRAGSARLGCGTARPPRRRIVDRRFLLARPRARWALARLRVPTARLEMALRPGRQRPRAGRLGKQAGDLGGGGRSAA